MSRKNSTIASPVLLLTRILRGHLLHRFRGLRPASQLHCAFEDACRVAESTGYPGLLLPVLAEERLRQAAEDYRSEQCAACAA